MGSLQGSIDLLKMYNAGIATIKGVRCLVIPIEGNDLYITKDETTGRAKAAYLGLNIRERKEISQYGKTHYAKQSLSKEFREGANPELVEAKRDTYLGDFKPLVFEEGNQQGTVSAMPVMPNEIEEDELPF